jgi:hypothetical protein
MLYRKLEMAQPRENSGDAINSHSLSVEKYRLNILGYLQNPDFFAMVCKKVVTIPQFRAK